MRQKKLQAVYSKAHSDDPFLLPIHSQAQCITQNRYLQSVCFKKDRITDTSRQREGSQLWSPTLCCSWDQSMTWSSISGTQIHWWAETSVGHIQKCYARKHREMVVTQTIVLFLIAVCKPALDSRWQHKEVVILHNWPFVVLPQPPAVWVNPRGETESFCCYISWRERSLHDVGQLTEAQWQECSRYFPSCGYFIVWRNVHDYYLICFHVTVEFYAILCDWAAVRGPGAEKYFVQLPTARRALLCN